MDLEQEMYWRLCIHPCCVKINKKETELLATVIEQQRDHFLWEGPDPGGLAGP